MKIVGIDPGLATVGVGIVEQCDNAQKRACGHARAVDFCTIETARGLSPSERLKEIADDLSGILRKHWPDLAVVEKLYFATNRKTAMDVAAARGVILLTVMGEGIPILEPTPLQLKTAITGDGRADKRQMRDMIARTLELDLRGVPDDTVDALGLAFFGAILSPTGAPHGGAQWKR